MLSNYDKYQIKYFDAIEAEAAAIMLWCTIHLLSLSLNLNIDY